MSRRKSIACKTEKIRKEFRKFFELNGFHYSESYCVSPKNDPSILFTNAGMVPFKNFFMALEEPLHPLYHSIQKCIRAGGKSCDLSNVGVTSRHISSFEMVGFFILRHTKTEFELKYESTDMLLKFLCDVLGLDKKKIWLTHHTQDTLSKEVCEKLVPSQRIIPLSDKDNFWKMGDTGPCGYCIEIIYDRGATYGTASTPYEDTTGDRFIEIWNLVFIQFTVDSSGITHKLTKMYVDTGGGLQRLAMIVEEKKSIFDTTPYKSLIKLIPTYKARSTRKKIANNTIADHFITCAWILQENITPGAQGKEYVLRKIMRRLILKWHFTLNLSENQLSQFIKEATHYVLPKNPNAIEICSVQFSKEYTALKQIIQKGDTLINALITHMKTANLTLIPVDKVFFLYDTHGIPIEYIETICQEHGYNIDMIQLEERLATHKQKVTTVTNSKEFHIELLKKLDSHLNTTSALTSPQELGFVGYESQNTSTNIIAIISHTGEHKTVLSTNNYGVIVTPKSTLFPTGGGQNSDTGFILSENNVFSVEFVLKTKNGLIAHFGVMKTGSHHVSETVVTKYDQNRRVRIMRAHSAVHLLSHLLKTEYSSKQAGSFIEEDYGRYDFTLSRTLTQEEIRNLNTQMNNIVLENKPTSIYTLSIEEANAKKDIDKFDDNKYQKLVRVVEVGPSKALCGGTHVTHAACIGHIQIIKEFSVGSGKHRIELVTGTTAHQLAMTRAEQLTQITTMLHTNNFDETISCIKKLKSEKKQLAQQLERLHESLAMSLSQTFISTKQTSRAVVARIAHHAIASRVAALLIQHGFPCVILWHYDDADNSLSYIIKTNAVHNAKQIFTAIQSQYPKQIGGGSDYTINARIPTENDNIIDSFNHKITTILEKNFFI